MVATFWSAVPNKTNVEIVQFIKESAHLFQNPTPQLGYGIPDFSEALANALALEQNEQDKSSAYPNPFSDFVSFALPDGVDNAKITFYNTLGQMVMERNVAEHQRISTEALASGVYFYSMQNGNEISNGKLIKQ
jgi:hypothetical protein